MAEPSVSSVVFPEAVEIECIVLIAAKTIQTGKGFAVAVA